MIHLGLRANWRQFSLLVLINAFVGAMVGLERAVLPLLGEQEFGLASRASILAFVASFGATKALANLIAGRLADRVGRKAVLLVGWAVGLFVPIVVIAAPTWEWVVIANALLGVNQGLCWSATVMMKVDLAGPTRRGLALGVNEFAGYVALGTHSRRGSWSSHGFPRRIADDERVSFEYVPVTAVVGAQWGDEGKGKITDLLAQEADVVIRFQGGNNAGHTVVNQHGTFKLHLVPSGIFNPNALCIVGPGTVVNLQVLCEELANLERSGIGTDNLRVADRAHLLMPWHVAIDRLDERERGRQKLGTTGQGVGPAYADKVSRHGIQVYEVRDERRFRRRVAHELERQKKVLERYGDAPLDAKVVADEVLAAAATLGERIVDTLPLVERALQTDARILLEGQLGAMRDLDWGIYPYVTSSNPLAGGAAVGAGIPPRYITKVIGVVKAYSTAVGEGPFPTEMAGGEGDALRERANEYGATTGRPRRVGWFDAVAARHAHRLNAFTELAVTKLDVLGAYQEIPFCVSYDVDGAMTTDMPPTAVLERAVPHYEKLAGWCDPLTGVADRAHLPAAARAYLSRIEATVGAPVGMVGIGPERSATLL